MFGLEGLSHQISRFIGRKIDFHDRLLHPKRTSSAKLEVETENEGEIPSDEPV